MHLPELEAGTLLRRYKRFLADVEDLDGEVFTAHCPNTGAMTGCAEPGSRVWCARSDNPKRKYAMTLELVESVHGLVSVNTGRANALIKEALHNGAITELAMHKDVRAEAKIPEGDGRFDFFVEGQELEGQEGQKGEGQEKNAWVEVKSTTLVTEPGRGAFPDAVSARALKHVEALLRRVAANDRGVLIFCAQHVGIDSVEIAHQIDSKYADGIRRALDGGVEILAYGCSISGVDNKPQKPAMVVDRQLPFTPPT